MNFYWILLFDALGTDLINQSFETLSLTVTFVNAETKKCCWYPRVSTFLCRWHRGRILEKTWCMGRYAGVDNNLPMSLAQRPNPKKNMVYGTLDYNLTLCRIQSRLQHIYHGQPHARVDFVPQSGTKDLASGLLTKVV